MHDLVSARGKQRVQGQPALYGKFQASLSHNETLTQKKGGGGGVKIQTLIFRGVAQAWNPSTEKTEENLIGGNLVYTVNSRPVKSIRIPFLKQ